MDTKDILAMLNKPKTGEEVRIEETKAINAAIVNPTPTPEPIEEPLIPEVRVSRHVKDEYGGSISDIPVGHQYWQGRYRKP